MSYGYQDSDHFHAVPHLDGVQKYRYDADGNMTDRIVGSDSYDLTYDADNRLVEVEKNRTTVGEYTYDGDGSRVKSVADEARERKASVFAGRRLPRSLRSLTTYAGRCGATRSYLFGDSLAP